MPKAPAQQVEYIPLSQFSGKIKAGWKMIAGYPLHPGDYAVLMVEPDPEIDSNQTAGAYSSGLRRICRNRVLAGDPA